MKSIVKPQYYKLFLKVEELPVQMGNGKTLDVVLNHGLSWLAYCYAGNI